MKNLKEKLLIHLKKQYLVKIGTQRGNAKDGSGVNRLPLKDPP